MQWNACVELSADAFERLPPEKVHIIRYEDFVVAPEGELRAICGFLGVEASPRELKEAVRGVSDRSVGKGLRDLDESTQERVTSLTAPVWAAVSELSSSRKERKTL